MSSIFKLFSKKKESHSMFERVIEQAASLTVEQYFATDDIELPSFIIDKQERYRSVIRILKAQRKKEQELKKQLFISWCTSRKKVEAPNEDFEAYLKLCGQIKELYPSEEVPGYFAERIWPVDYSQAIVYEVKEKSSACYDEEFKNFLLQTLKSVNRHLAHEMKQACSQGKEDKRNKFRTFCRINIKSLDDTDSSEINTSQHPSINFKQNYNGTRKYRWAS